MHEGILMDTSHFNVILLVIVLIGWAFNMGILWQMSRNHGDKLKTHDEEIKELRTAITTHHENQSVHTSAEWRTEMREWMQKVENSLEGIRQTCMKRLINKDC